MKPQRLTIIAAAPKAMNQGYSFDNYSLPKWIGSTSDNGLFIVESWLFSSQFDYFLFVLNHECLFAFGHKKQNQVIGVGMAFITAFTSLVFLTQKTVQALSLGPIQNLTTIIITSMIWIFIQV
jgi:hypothetical protein